MQNKQIQIEKNIEMKLKFIEQEKEHWTKNQQNQSLRNDNLDLSTHVAELKGKLMDAR